MPNQTPDCQPATLPIASRAVSLGGGGGPAKRAATAANAAPSLDAPEGGIETTVHRPFESPYVPDNAAQRRLHAVTAAARSRILGALADVAADPAAARVHRTIRDCGRHPVVCQQGESGPLVRVWARCRHRLCPTCGMIRSRKLRDDLEPIARAIDAPRLLTLTIRSTSEPLRVLVDRLRDAFRRLRRTKAWRKHVSGGVAVVEVTYNAARDQWHPHLHLLCEGSYWRQSAIADLWEGITGDSRIVDIRAVHSRKAAVAYCLKYVTKSQSLPPVPPHRLLDWVHGMKGQRMAQTFGTMHGRPCGGLPKPSGEPLSPVVPLAPLYRLSEAGDPAAAILLAMLQRHAAHPDQVPAAQLVTELRRWWDGVREAERMAAAPPQPPPKPRIHRARSKPPPPPREWW